MRDDCGLDRVHAFWLGELFVSPPLRQILRRDGRSRLVPRDAMRVLVALASEGPATPAALAQRCLMSPGALARALRRLDRIGFRLLPEGERLRLVVGPVLRPASRRAVMPLPAPIAAFG